MPAKKNIQAERRKDFTQTGIHKRRFKKSGKFRPLTGTQEKKSIVIPATNPAIAEFNNFSIKVMKMLHVRKTDLIRFSRRNNKYFAEIHTRGRTSIPKFFLIKDKSVIKHLKEFEKLM